MTEKKFEIEIDPSVVQDAVDSVDQTAATKESAKEAELRDQMLRIAADFDNFRKRTQKEKSELVRYGNETLLRDLIPVIDNFERAVEHARKAKDVDSIAQGIELILSQLNATLGRAGLVTQSAKGAAFDPMVHEAVSHVEVPGSVPGTVVEEHQKAYFLHDRLVRPALVTVSKPAAENPGDANPEE